MDSLSDGTGRNIWYTSIFYIFPAFIGFVFWFLAAKIAGPEAVGITASLASLSTILVAINVLGAPTGMKQYLGRAFFSGKIGEFKQILSSTLAIVLVTVTVTAAFLYVPYFGLPELLGINGIFINLLVILIVAQSFQLVFSEALISSFTAKKLVIPQIVGGALRFPLLIFIIYFAPSFESIGTAIAFSSLFIVTTVLYGMEIVKLVSNINEKAIQHLVRNAKTVLKAGLSSWVPTTLRVVGYQLGTLTVFSAMGAIEGSRIYLTMTIFLISLFLVQSINLVIHPLIGNISDSETRKKYLAATIKIAFIFTMPIAALLFFYGKDILFFLGAEYAPASNALSILMLSTPFVIISEIVYFFHYGIGNHKNVLYLGLAGNIPRVILYILLSADFGATGAALSYLTGSILQLILSLVVLKRDSIKLEYMAYFKITLVSMLIGGLFWSIGVSILIGVPVTFIVCLYLDVKMKIMSPSLIQSITYGVLPERTANKVHAIIERIVKRI